jgi:hypothetical protein
MAFLWEVRLVLTPKYIQFVERFATDSLLHAEGKDLHSKLKYKHDLKKENAALRPITAEVKRLITPGMGSLEVSHGIAAALKFIISLIPASKLANVTLILPNYKKRLCTTRQRIF